MTFFFLLQNISFTDNYKYVPFVGTTQSVDSLLNCYIYNKWNFLTTLTGYTVIFTKRPTFLYWMFMWQEQTGVLQNCDMKNKYLLGMLRILWNTPTFVTLHLKKNISVKLNYIPRHARRLYNRTDITSKVSDFRYLNKIMLNKPLK